MPFGIRLAVVMLVYFGLSSFHDGSFKTFGTEPGLTGVALLRKRNMKIKITIIFWVGLMLIVPDAAKAQKWRKVVPLKSTRLDVERLLGPAEKPTELTTNLGTGFCL